MAGKRSRHLEFSKIVEMFRKLLMEYHAHDLSMNEISNRAHKAARIICGAQP